VHGAVSVNFGCFGAIYFGVLLHSAAAAVAPISFNERKWNKEELECSIYKVRYS
jgi:hypothetical protein